MLTDFSEFVFKNYIYEDFEKIDLKNCMFFNCLRYDGRDTFNKDYCIFLRDKNVLKIPNADNKNIGKDVNFIMENSLSISGIYLSETDTEFYTLKEPKIIQVIPKNKILFYFY